MGRTIKLLLAFLIFTTFTSYSQEVIESFDEENISVLNEELRKLRDRLDVIENIESLEDSILWEQSTDVQLKTADDVDMQSKEIKNHILDLRTSDPGSPIEGQIWYRTDI